MVHFMLRSVFRGKRNDENGEPGRTAAHAHCSAQLPVVASGPLREFSKRKSRNGSVKKTFMILKTLL